MLPLLLLALACNRDPKGGDPGFEVSDVDDPGQSLDDDTGDTTGDSGETGGEETGGDDTGGGQAADTRTFAMLQVVATVVTDPGPFTDDQEQADTTSVLLVDWRREGTSLTWTETTCSVEQSEVFDTVTSFPDAFVEHLPVRTRTGELSAPETGATLTAGPFVDLVSVDLEDPSGDDLPEEADDDRVFDLDEDGQPGVTVHIDQAIMGEGDVYVVQRSIARMDGVVVAADRIEGYLESSPEQSVLAASEWWLELDAPPPEPDPEPSHSYFVLQQVADGATCADILAQRATLFD